MSWLIIMVDCKNGFLIKWKEEMSLIIKEMINVNGTIKFLMFLPFVLAVVDGAKN